MVPSSRSPHTRVVSWKDAAVPPTDLTGTHVLQKAFRESLAATPANAKRAAWLTDWIRRSPTEADRIGLEYVGFGNTAARALGWYKWHKRPFTPLGWQIDTETLLRTRRGLDRSMDEFVSDAAASPEAIMFLNRYPRDPMARYMAIDALFQTVTPRPIRTVLDYGSGIGRAALIWSFEREDVAFVSVDATESLYLLQHELYGRLFGPRFCELLTAKPDSVVPLVPGAVAHVPSWTMDRAIPDASIDLIVCVQVLQELPEPALRFALDQFRRVIRPHGLLYIRDNEFWTPEHRVRVGRVLLTQGWHLAFRYPGNDGTDIAGVPRMWTFTGEDYSRYFQLKTRLKRALLPSYAKSYRSWRDIGLPL